jgi:hypothetical protein
MEKTARELIDKGLSDTDVVECTPTYSRSGCIAASTSAPSPTSS